MSTVICNIQFWTRAVLKTAAFLFNTLAKYQISITTIFYRFNDWSNHKILKINTNICEMFIDCVLQNCLLFCNIRDIIMIFHIIYYRLSSLVIRLLASERIRVRRIRRIVHFMLFRVPNSSASLKTRVAGSPISIEVEFPVSVLYGDDTLLI